MVLKINKWKNRWTLVVRIAIGYPYYKGSPSVTTEIITEKYDVVMICQESTTKVVKLFGYDFRGNTRGTLAVGIAYGYPYCKGSAIFSLVFLSTTSEKSFIPYKPSATMQATKVSPVRPRVFVQFGQESCPAGEYLHSERLWMLEKVSATLNTTPTTIPRTPHISKNPQKKNLGNNFVREAEGCRWELKARNSAIQLCAYYDSSCFAAAGLVVDLAT